MLVCSGLLMFAAQPLELLSNRAFLIKLLLVMLLVMLLVLLVLLAMLAGLGVPEIKVGDALSQPGSAFIAEQGDAVLRVAYLFAAGKA